MRFYVIKLPKFLSKIIAFFVKLFSKKDNGEKRKKWQSFDCHFIMHVQLNRF